jgi:hypothetical protein
MKSVRITVEASRCEALVQFIRLRSRRLVYVDLANVCFGVISLRRSVSKADTNSAALRDLVQLFPGILSREETSNDAARASVAL